MKHAVFIALLLLCVAFVALGVRGYHAEVLAPGSRLNLLLADKKAGEAVGLIHGESRVTQLEGGRAPCVVSYRRKKSDYSMTVQEGARITMADGRTFDVAWPPGVEFFGSSRPRGLPSQETRLKILAENGLNESNRPEITCVDPAEAIYVVGCAHPGGLDQLVACSGDERVLLAPGSEPTPYVASYAADGAAWLALAMLGVLFAALSIWLRWAFLRPIVRDLSAHARATARSGEPRDLFGLIFAGTLVVTAIIFLAVRGRSGLYLLPMGAVLLAFALLYLFIGVRFRKLHAALKIVRGLSTSKLAECGDDISELMVRVSADAPLIDPIAGAHKPAFIRAKIVEVLSVPGKKGSKVDVSAERAVLSYPRHLPIEDVTAATLDMENCRLDTAAQPSVITTGSLSLPAWASEALAKSIEPAEHHKQFIIHWGKLDPGDSLLLYGQVGRLRAGEGGAQPRTGGYRTAPVALAVQGKAVAYHGEERELAPSLARERTLTLALSLVLVTAVVATVVASIHAATQV